MLISELPIKESITSSLKLSGFVTATPVQAATIPSLLKTDVIVQSETGSGKTLAYLLPIAHILERNSRKIQALVVAPTRELCRQIQDVSKLLDMNCQSFIGGSDIESDRMILECSGRMLQSVDCSNEDIPKRTKISSSKESHDIAENISNRCISLVAATPGRILELLHTHSKYFSNIKYLILDEADKLLSAGFETKILEIISLLPKSRKTGLFSATINEGVERICRACLRQPRKILLEGVPSGLELTYLMVKPSDKIKLAIKLVVNSPMEVIDSSSKPLERKSQEENCNSIELKGDFSSKKTIIFFATCAQVDFYYSLLQKLFEGRIELRKIHGKMPQHERNEIYDGFSGGILLCTDVAARGIDFKHIELVIHYDVPKDSENIVHRSGRTARCKQNGIAVLFLMDNETSYINYLKVIGISISEFEGIVGKGHIENTPAVLNNDSTNCQLFSSLNNNPSQFIDEGLLSLSVRAFVSYIRSYKEHKINHILNYKNLDFDDLANAFYLKKIPQMNELKNVVFKNYVREGKTKRYDGKSRNSNEERA